MADGEVILSPDDQGEDKSESIKLLQVAGRVYPNFGEEKAREIRNINTFNVRDDDIWLVNYPKSGTHWIWEVLRMLLNSTTDIEAVPKDIGMIELSLFSAIEKLESPRVLNSHLKAEVLEEILVKTPAKVIYTYRNPKDVLVSSWHHCRSLKVYEYTGTFDGFFKLHMNSKTDYGNWFDHTREWYMLGERLPKRFLALSFEDMIEDSQSNIRRLADFLGIPATEEFVQTVAENTQFSVMQERANACEDPNEYVDGKPNMLRKGKVGTWKEVLSDEHSALIDKKIEVDMKDVKFNIRFEL